MSDFIRLDRYGRQQFAGRLQIRREVEGKGAAEAGARPGDDLRNRRSRRTFHPGAEAHRGGGVAAVKTRV